MSGAATKNAQYGEGTVVITRVLDAPRALVWQAWTDPKMLGEWFGPRGFTSSVPELDLRVGGALRIVMHGPDGNDYPMKGVFREVVAPERLVFSNIAIDKDGHHLLEGGDHVGRDPLGGQIVLPADDRIRGDLQGDRGSARTARAAGGGGRGGRRRRACRHRARGRCAARGTGRGDEHHGREQHAQAAVTPRFGASRGSSSCTVQIIHRCEPPHHLPPPIQPSGPIQRVASRRADVPFAGTFAARTSVITIHRR